MRRYVGQRSLVRDGLGSARCGVAAVGVVAIGRSSQEYLGNLLPRKASRNRGQQRPLCGVTVAHLVR
jgi:hypothetical protein